MEAVEALQPDLYVTMADEVSGVLEGCLRVYSSD